MFRTLTILLFLLPLAISAQPGRDSIYYQKEKNQPGVLGAKNLKDVYIKLADTFYGVFGADTQCSPIQSVIYGARIPGNVKFHLLQGMSWHLGIENRFIIKPKITSMLRVSAADCVDTLYTEPAARNLIDSLVTQNWEIHLIEGNYTLTEDSTGKFAGNSEGIFKFTFLFNPVSNLIASIPKSVLLQEPSVIYTGLWNPKNRNDVNVPYFFSSLKPFVNQQKEVIIPDFRIQPDGQVHPEKWITLRDKQAGKKQ